MANENRISVIITADASGAITGLRLAGDATEQLGTRTASTFDRIKANWKELTAGALAAYYAFKKVWSLAEESAQLQERMDMLDRLTRRYGMGAEALTGQINRASHGLIGLKDAAQVSTDALVKGFTPEQITNMANWGATLSKVSASSNQSSGSPASQALSTLDRRPTRLFTRRRARATGRAPALTSPASVVALSIRQARSMVSALASATARLRPL